MTNLQNEGSGLENKSPKPRKRGKRIIVTLICCLMSIVIITLAAAGIMWYSGKRGMTSGDVKLTPGEGFTAIINQDNTVVYKGRVYKYNENIATLLCVGVDNDKKTSGGAYVIGRAGQADAIYLLAVDTKTGKTTVLGIPRDTITDIDVYTKSGSYVGVEKTQLCLAFAYGDGKKTSCENTVKAVSRLLYGMPINSYFSVDNKAIPALHNAVGPITVVPNETLDSGLTHYEKGVKYTLYGSNVFAYLQMRNQNTANASYLRMQRQLDYIKKYCEKAVEKTKDNILFPIELYKKVQKNAVTNIDAGKIAYMAGIFMDNRETASMEFVSVEGKQIKGEDNFAEFYPDEEKLFEAVLSIYYTELK